MKIDDYKKPGWATFCRILGWICVLGFGAAILSDKYIKGSEALTLFGLGIGYFIHFFLSLGALIPFQTLGITLVKLRLP